MTRRLIIVAVCAVIGVVAAFGQYMHRGYVGVIESGDTLRLLGRGPHFRAPWKHVALYPVQAHQIHIKSSSEDPQLVCRADAVLNLSVCRDSLRSLHKAYRGAYIENLVSPLIIEFLRRRGDASATWYEGKDSDRIGKEMVNSLNSSLAPYGITVYTAWLLSFDVATVPADTGKPSAH